jgi:predicted kinase
VEDTIMIYVMIGPPGCGKSTYVKNSLNKPDTIILRPDDFVIGEFSWAKWKVIHEFLWKTYKCLLDDNTGIFDNNIILDDIFIAPKHRKKYIKHAKKKNRRIIAVVLKPYQKNALKETERGAIDQNTMDQYQMST